MKSFPLVGCSLSSLPYLNLKNTISTHFNIALSTYITHFRGNINRSFNSVCMYFVLQLITIKQSSCNFTIKRKVVVITTDDTPHLLSGLYQPAPQTTSPHSYSMSIMIHELYHTIDITKISFYLFVVWLIGFQGYQLVSIKLGSTFYTVIRIITLHLM